MWPHSNPVDPTIYTIKANWPKISIVTPSYNQGQFIEETILSVLNQNYPNLEYIIIDGGSTDNTVDIIQKYEHKITYWVSEQDKGQANAINKGLDKCTGQIFSWINSDDYLERNGLYKIALGFDVTKFDILAGSVINFWSESTKKSIYKNANINISHILRVIRKSKLKYHQPGVWFKTENVKYIGRYNEASHYCFDIDHLISYLSFFPKVKYIDDILVHFRYHEVSKSIQFAEKFTVDYLNCLRHKTSQDNQLTKKIKRKYKTLKWDLHLKHYILKTNKKGNFYIFKNIFLSPKFKLTKYALIVLRKKFKLEIKSTKDI